MHSLFDQPGPRMFGVSPGADFPKTLFFGLEQRLIGAQPQDWATVEIYVATQRMRRRLIDLIAQGPARLMPRIRLVTSLGDIAMLPPAVPPLRRRLELTQLISRLLDAQPDLAPRTALFDLADSLADLMDEMHGEAVEPADLHALDVSHLSAHWDRTRSFIRIVEQFFGDAAQSEPDREARNRLAAELLAERWRKSPPQHPVIVAGSTGSRGATALFMAAVAQLAQGAVVLPGFDFDLPEHVWDGMDSALTAEDHPQYRFRRLSDLIGIHPSKTQPWFSGEIVSNSARNRAVSLALRPAPVTDQWLDEGRELGGLVAATQDLTLIEAASPREEALAIALRMRGAIQDGQTAALITPDRMLTRQVTAALDRWGIEPDDSAGLPLQLSAPGRFLRHVADLFGRPLSAEALLTLLKHPLACSTVGLRGPHLKWTHELELYLRRHSHPFPNPETLSTWADTTDQEDGRADWARWVETLLCGLDSAGIVSLSDHLDRHIALAERLAAGPEPDGSGELWQKAAGEAALAAVAELQSEAAHAGDMSTGDYSDLMRSVLARNEVNDPVKPHPQALIWGTLEARVQGADVVILAGLNEGIWPQMPPPDPWLNRDMRAKLGLLLPERRIGLSAHDFQQAIAAPTVVLSRAVRDAEAETVPSRWINRLTNLLSGLDRQGGKAALAQMRARGQVCLRQARQLDEPDQMIAPATRPSPMPPPAVRPKRLSVTRIQTLIRDPYAIYAQYILGVSPLDPLAQSPSPQLRGIVLHKVFERFVEAGVNPDSSQAKYELLDAADAVLADMAPWPSARVLWRARLETIIDKFLAEEYDRQQLADARQLEEKGTITLKSGFILSAEADRVDHRHDGSLAIFDYKTGAPPSPKQVKHYDKQLLLEAAIAEQAGFGTCDPAPVSHAAYIGLGSAAGEGKNLIEEGSVATTLDSLEYLIDRYAQRQQGYTSRRSIFSRAEQRDYDHLARYGEWDETNDPDPQEVGDAT